MTVVFDAPVEIVNLTLSGYMLLFALSTLLWGPLSDKYGRKPILRTGLSVYFVASCLCALSPNIYCFISARLLQACGGGAISSVCLAVVKDCYKGRSMGTVLAWLQTIAMLAPMVAPVLGAFLLKFFSWSGLFYVLAAGGAFGLIGSLSLRESLQVRTEGSPFHSLGRIGYVLGQKNFTSLLLIFSIMTMPFMTYLGSSAYIYMETFRLSAQTYSYFFLFNAAVCMSAPLLYMRFFRDLGAPVFMKCFLGIIVAASLLLGIYGGSGPFGFALLFAPITFGGMIMKPFGAVLMMRQLDTDTGTVASLIVCFGLLGGSLAIFLCSLSWLNFISRCAIIAGGAGMVSLVLWGIFYHLRLFRVFKDSGRNV